MSFQFHNGTINTLSTSTRRRPGSSFNSTTVQLIRERTLLKDWIYQFQFHNGTINTKKKHKKLSKTEMFQFHNGTINTFVRPAVLCLFGCFNSTTVQLIRYTPATKTYLYTVSIPQRYN